MTTTDTWPMDSAWLPELPRDRAYAADLQLGTQLADGDDRVTLLQQLPGGSVRLSTGGAPIVLPADVLADLHEALQVARRHAPDHDRRWLNAEHYVQAARGAHEHCWTEHATTIVPIRVPESTPTRSAVAALQQLTDEVELLVQAERPRTHPEATGFAEVARTPLQAPAAAEHPQALPEGGTGHHSDTTEHVRLTTPWIEATYHLVRRAAMQLGPTAKALCGIERRVEGDDAAWQVAGPHAVRLCAKCRGQLPEDQQ